MNYDPTKDFAPIYFYVKSPFVLVVDPKLPINSVPELIKYAKESATPMTYSTAGVGSSQHLSMEFMAQQLRTEDDARAVSRVAAGESPTSRPVTSMSGFAEAGASLPLIRTANCARSRYRR